MLNIFKKKKKQQEEEPANSGSDTFQAPEPSSLPKASPKAPAEPSVKEISPYDNELLLRGKIGMSTGSPALEKPEKDEKLSKEPIKTTSPDKIETEQAQVMKINLNKKLDEGE